MMLIWKSMYINFLSDVWEGHSSQIMFEGENDVDLNVSDDISKVLRDKI